MERKAYEKKCSFYDLVQPMALFNGYTKDKFPVWKLVHGVSAVFLLEPRVRRWQTYIYIGARTAECLLIVHKDRAVLHGQQQYTSGKLEELDLVLRRHQSGPHDTLALLAHVEHTPVKIFMRLEVDYH